MHPHLFQVRYIAYLFMIYIVRASLSFWPGVLCISCYKDVEDFSILQHDIPSKIFIAKESFEVLNIAI